MCAKSSGGQILATAVVRALVGRHATESFVEIGAVELKGIPEPLEVIEVVWAPTTAAGVVPLPARLVGVSASVTFGFFGRAAELVVLDEARERAHTTRRAQVVLVAGEAGMGKTALSAQFARAMHADGAVVLFGHADEDLGIAYQPWIEVVSSLVRDGDADVRLGTAPRPACRATRSRAPDRR